MIASYCWPQSAHAGEAVTLFCHTTAGSYNVEVVRQGADDRAVLVREELPGSEQAMEGELSAEGCPWTGSLEFRIDPDWPSGLYLVRLTDSEENRAYAFFVVRSRRPADALLVLATSTWNAYNTWGGKSLYTGGHTVSPMRPLQPGFLTRDDPYRHRLARFKHWNREDARAFARAGYDPFSMAAGWSNWERLFVQWAERRGYRLDFAISQDLDRDPDVLSGYTTYLSVGHDEYWSRGMRDAVEGFIDAGGNAAFFSGNTAFWQVRFDDDYRQMTSYKFDLRDDPVYDPVHAPILSTMWSDPLVARPESRMTGVSFTRGGYARMPNAPDGTGGYTVWQPDHWAFNCTQLKAGDSLGARDLVVGYECDGCEVDYQDGRLVPTFRDDTPEGFEVLATAPAHLWETHEAVDGLAANYVGELNWVAERVAGDDTPENRSRFADGHAVMGTFKRGKGEVFTTGCTDWAYGLRDEQVARVTTNVLNRFISVSRID